jgi:hypothetical protein
VAFGLLTGHETWWFANDSFALLETEIMSRTNLTATRVLELAEALSDREQRVLISLRLVRLATGAQLERLHFADIGGRERRRVMASLAERRLVARLPRRIGGTRAGSAGYLYSLDVAGQRVVSFVGPAGRGRIQRPWTPGLPFIAHTLAVAELYVELCEASRGGRLEVHEFTAEPLSWRRYVGRSGAKQVLKPDAFVRLGVGGFEDHWFIEVDRATEAPATIDAKLTAYRRYWSSGREQAKSGLFPRVLWLVPDERRQQVLIDACGRQPSESWALFMVARQADAVTRLSEGAA